MLGPRGCAIPDLPSERADPGVGGLGHNGAMLRDRWTRWLGPEPGTLFDASRHRYRFEGYRQSVEFANYVDRGVVEVLEYEPLGQPNQPHVYLSIPVYPTTTADIRGRLEHVVAAISDAFRLPWHMTDWPAKAVGCGIVLAAAAPGRYWPDGWPDDSPGIEIPVGWLREPHAHSMRNRSDRREATVQQVVPCLGHPIPVWPKDANDLASVSSWRPGDPAVSVTVPVDLADDWMVCQDAATRASESQEGLRRPRRSGASPHHQGDPPADGPDRQG